MPPKIVPRVDRYTVLTNSKTATAPKIIKMAIRRLVWGLLLLLLVVSCSATGEYSTGFTRNPVLNWTVPVVVSSMVEYGFT